MHFQNLTWAVQLAHVPRVWMLFDAIDGTWLMLPLAIIGSVLNAFLLWILRTKANLHIGINASISVECFARLVFCAIIFPYKTWILTISPLLGISILPSPKECFSAAVLSYLTSVVQAICNLLTNVQRYMYIRAGKAENKRAVKIRALPRLQNHLLALGVILVVFHVGTTYFAEHDQFIFDQGCLRPHDVVKLVTAPTFWLYSFVSAYIIPSSVICALIFSYVLAERKRLNKSLNSVGTKPNKNYYSAGTGIAQVAVLLFFMLLMCIPKMAAHFYGVKISSSLESFLMEFSIIVTNGIISPGIILWSSSETRIPAIRMVKQAWIGIWRRVNH